MSREPIAVVGAGLMGHGIAQVFASVGHSVRVYDVSRSALDAARHRIGVQLGLPADTAADTGPLSRILFTEDLGEALEGVPFVVEAVPENLELKQNVFRRVSELAPEQAILASNTSTLSVTQMGAGTARPENQVIAHWFNPPYLIPVVEVVRGDHTSEATVAKTVDLLRGAGKAPVRVKREVPGFLVNRLQAALFREALSLLEAGVAEPEDLDRAVRGSFGLRLAAVGPLETADLGGLELWLKGMAYLYPHLSNATEPQGILQDKVARGHTGAKGGTGFFAYGDGGLEAEKRRDALLLRLVKILYPDVPRKE